MTTTYSYNRQTLTVLSWLWDTHLWDTRVLIRSRAVGAARKNVLACLLELCYDCDGTRESLVAFFYSTTIVH